MAIHNLGDVHWLQGDYAEARGCYEQAQRICREIGFRADEGRMLGRLGAVSAAQGHYARARAYGEQGLRISREIDDRRRESAALYALGDVCRYQGDYAGSSAYYDQSLRISREIGARQAEGWVMAFWSLLSHQLGDDEAAREYSRQALRITRDLGDRYSYGYALTHLGHALAGLRQLTEAADAYRRALALRRQLGQSHLAPEPLAGLARVALAQGDQAQALAHVEEIVRYLETHPTLDGTEEPFRVYLTCYRVLRANHDPRAGDILDTAHRLLQERAAKIEDEELRRSFLENVAAHRETVEEWGKATTGCTQIGKSAEATKGCTQVASHE